MDIKTALEEWIEVSKITKHPNTIKMHYQLLKKQYLELVGNHKLSNFKPRHAEKLIKGLKAQGLSIVTINMRIERLNTFLNWAHSKHYLQKISKLKEHRKLPASCTTFTPCFNIFSGTGESIRSRRCVKLQERFLMALIGTGARRSEIFYLTWNQIDFGRKIITVHHTDEFEVKEGREKELVMPDFLAAYLWSERQANPKEKFLLDDGNGRRLYQNPVSLSQAFSRHFQRMGWKNRRINRFTAFEPIRDALFNRGD